MEQTAMVQRVLEAGKDQPIGIAAIIMVLGLQAYPFISGNSIDPEMISGINERTKYIERVSKETKTSLGTFSRLSTALERHVDRTATGHRDIEQSIGRILDKEREHAQGIKDVLKVVTDNQHLFDILKLRLDALERNGGSSSGRSLQSPFTEGYP